MATRPFEYGKKDYIDRMNDLYETGLPRVRLDPDDPDSAPTDITASRQMRLGDNGCVCDCKGSGITITFHPECLVDGWSVFLNVYTPGGTVTINPVAAAGVAFVDGSTTKTLTINNAALISSNGTGFRIFRMTAT
jgi:hypothetical protein